MTKRQDLCLQRRSRSEQSDQRQPNQTANISHQPRASPDSTALTSQIEFPTMTGIAPPGERLPVGAMQTRTDFGVPGYGGPCPPRGSEHDYIITLTALGVEKLPGIVTREAT